MTDLVAVTGVGVVCALGSTLAEVDAGMRAGRRTFAPVRRFEASALRVNLAAEAPALDIAGRFGRAIARRASRTDRMALWAAAEALEQARLPAATARGTAVYVGASTAGVAEMESARAHQERVSFGTYWHYPVWATALTVGRALALYGPRATYMTACSSSAHAIGVAMHRLRAGELNAALAGGAEALSLLTLTGFASLGVLDPDGTRPFDAARRGITLGEGAAFLVLEPLSHAEHRGARVLALVAGYGASADACHPVHPREDGDGAVRAICHALDDAGVAADEVDYVNAHGTGTTQNDAMEAKALRRVFGERGLRVSSSKSMFGHTLGAAGALEAAATVIGINGGFVPPSTGVRATAPELGGLRLVHQAEPHCPQATLSTSFAFGGNNAALVILAPEAGRTGLGSTRPAVRVPVVISGAAVSCAAGTARDPLAIWSLLEAGGGGPDLAQFDPAVLLGRNAVRRLDALSAATAAICALARDSAGISETRGLGIAFGTSFGSVDATMAFLDRLFEKGAALVNPLDFPNLVHNAGAGHASMALSARGPNITPAQEEQSGDEAVRLMLERIRGGELATAIAGGGDLASKALDAAYGLVDRVVGTQSQHASVIAALVLEADESCRRRGATPWARIQGMGAAGPEGGITAAIVQALAAPPSGQSQPDGADLWLTGATEPLGAEHERVAAEHAFARRARVIPARSRLGDAGGAGAAAIALGAAAVRLGYARCVLVTVVTREGSGCATILGPATS